MRAGTPLQQLLAQAARLGADTLELEYRDGYDEVSVLKGGVGFALARFPSMGRHSTTLRQELGQLARQKRRTVIVSGTAYEVRARADERFAEEAWEVRLRPCTAGGGGGSRRSRGRTLRRVGLRASDSEPAL